MRARRLEPQQAVKRALVVSAVVALMCFALPDVFLPVATFSPMVWENDLRSLVALVPLLAWYVAAGVMLHRG